MYLIMCDRCGKPFFLQAGIPPVNANTILCDECWEKEKEEKRKEESESQS